METNILTYRFGPFHVEVLKRQVFRDDEPLECAPLVFTFLELLMKNHERAIKNQEIFDQLWPGQQGLEEKLKDLFRRLCKLVGDENRQKPKYIVRKGGYLRVLIDVTEGQEVQPTPSLETSTNETRSQRIGFSLLRENKKIWDAFIAVPMAALSSKQYSQQRGKVSKLIKSLRREWGRKQIYCPAEHIVHADGWDPPDIAMKRGLQAIASSRIFIMVYTAEKPSSILVEAGFALAHNIPSFYFVRSGLDLPFLLHAANQAFSEVKVYPFTHFDEIVRIMKEYKDELSTLLLSPPNV